MAKILANSVHRKSEVPRRTAPRPRPQFAHDAAVAYRRRLEQMRQEPVRRAAA